MLKHRYRKTSFCALFWVLGLQPALSTTTEPNPPGAHQDSEFSGPWANERGSVVHLSLSNGMLTGVYQTNLGQPDKSQRFPLTGFVQNHLITFTVNFAGYGSMTSWAGQLSEDSDGPYIRTLWHLTRDIEDTMEDAHLWRSITAGASDFRPIQPSGPKG